MGSNSTIFEMLDASQQKYKISIMMFVKKNKFIYRLVQGHRIWQIKYNIITVGDRDETGTYNSAKLI